MLGIVDKYSAPCSSSHYYSLFKCSSFLQMYLEAMANDSPDTTITEYCSPKVLRPAERNKNVDQKYLACDLKNIPSNERFRTVVHHIGSIIDTNGSPPRSNTRHFQPIYHLTFKLGSLFLARLCDLGGSCASFQFAEPTVSILKEQT